MTANPLATLQLISTANIAIGLDSRTPRTRSSECSGTTFRHQRRQVTWAETRTKIGRNYHGSFNDARLNALVKRFSEDPTAITNLVSYETSGRLHGPLITLHTAADPIVPFWQETLYKAKVASAGASRQLLQIPVLAYGHCNVNAKEAGAALLLMVLKAGL